MAYTTLKVPIKWYEQRLDGLLWMSTSLPDTLEEME